MIWKILGCFGHIGDRDCISQYYHHKNNLSQAQQAKIFSTFSHICAYWAAVVGACLVSGCLPGLAAQGYAFTYATLPPIALIVAGVVLIHLAIDLSKNGRLAQTLAIQGGVDYLDEQNDPFPIKYLVKQSVYPRLTSYIINQITVEQKRN